MSNLLGRPARATVLTVSAVALLWPAGAAGAASGAAGAAAAGTPTCAGLPATLVGTPRDDRLVGTPGRDVVVARAGDDVVIGRGGNDVVCGGDGADVLRGGAGDDRLLGQRDALRSDRGGRYLDPDVLAGGAGDDVLDLGGDQREAQGQHGVLDFQGSRAGVVVDLVAGTATGQGSDTVLARVPADCTPTCAGVAVLGSPYADRLSGSAGPDQLVGGAGDDLLEGRGGADELRGEGLSKPEAGFAADADVLTGGRDADLIVSWTGRDELYGDDGDDVVWSVGGGPSQVFGGNGDDEVVAWFPPTPAFMLDGGAGHDSAQVLAPQQPGAGGRPTEALYDGETGEATADGTVWGRIGTVEELFFGGGVQWTCQHTGPVVVTGCTPAPAAA